MEKLEGTPLESIARHSPILSQLDSVAVAQSQEAEEIDWQELFWTLWDYRKAITMTVVAAMVISGLCAFIIPKRYKADALISPVDNSSTHGKAGGLGGQLGGLANLAGLSVNNDSDKDVAIATLNSRVLIEGMIRDENLLPILFKDRWDAEANAWSNPKNAPTLLDGYALFKRRIAKVEDDKKKSLVTVTVEWTSPDLAAHWANELVKRTNDLLRQRALDESEHNLSYLGEQAGRTSIVELLQAIYALMESELNKQMLAKGNEQYAFKIIDPAVVPEKKSSPKRGLFLVLGSFSGLFLSIAGALIHSSLRRGPRREA